MKQIVIGDIHGKSIWKKIIEKHPDFNRVIFIGDYLDAFDVLPIEQLHNLEEIVAFKKDCTDQEVILLIGNHDHHYWPGVLGGNTSGYQPRMLDSFRFVFNENINLFQMAFVDEYDNVYTHAGITETFLHDTAISSPDIGTVVDRLNALFHNVPNSFIFYSGDRSWVGDNVHQSPIWVRPKALHKDGINYNQIVGHTRQDFINYQPSLTKQYWYIDALDDSKEFLVIRDGIIRIDSVDEKSEKYQWVDL